MKRASKLTIPKEMLEALKSRAKLALQFRGLKNAVYVFLKTLTREHLVEVFALYMLGRKQFRSYNLALASAGRQLGEHTITQLSDNPNLVKYVDEGLKRRRTGK